MVSQAHSSLAPNAAASVYKKRFTIRYSDINLHAELKMVKIFDYFQDIASEHAALMGVSGYDVLRKSLAWVIFRYHLKIEKLPSWNEIIEIQTFRSSYKKLYETRFFQGMDKEGQLLFEGKTAWILVDVATRKPARLDKHLPQLLTGYDISSPGDYEFLDPEPLTQVDEEAFFTVGMMDLDFNKHVNNSVYPAWAMEAVPEEILFAAGVAEIDIRFVSEALYKERIISQVQRINGSELPCFLHRIVRETDHMELARLKSLWRTP